jgi:hypothetical protein
VWSKWHHLDSKTMENWKLGKQNEEKGEKIEREEPRIVSSVVC